MGFDAAIDPFNMGFEPHLEWMDGEKGDYEGGCMIREWQCGFDVGGYPTFWDMRLVLDDSIDPIKHLIRCCSNLKMFTKLTFILVLTR